ncbi:MAG: fused MFS/spermidine synthase, partial [Acidobacteria bacterium]|nr:fused MFS/spermidine synthase [Acidobacteriota bacterium]
FLLEPMAAKLVLPLLGGAPAVWNTCVVFFQAMLLAGYAYAHAGPAWLGVRRHAALHLLLLVGSFLTLQLTLDGAARSPEANPFVWLLLLLVRFIGLPFFLLATTAPLLQKWFCSTSHSAARDPYFLYSASNLGSLAGLLLYPIVVEPSLRLQTQASVWVFGYAAFALGSMLCAATLWRRSAQQSGAPDLPTSARETAAAIPWSRRFRWLVLALAPSSLMLAVTTFVSTDIAAVPLLWILPLALYLLTFVLAFSATSRYPRAIVDRALPLLILPLALFMILQINGPIAVVIPVHLLVFFLAALTCHRQVAEDRPDPAHLTEFYFWIALGGILGSLFNTLVAPLVFTAIVEYPTVLVLVCLLRRVPEGEKSVPRALRFAMPVAAGVFTLAVMLAGPRIESTVLRFGLLAVPAFLCLTVSRLRLPFAVGIGLMLLGSAFQPDPHGDVLSAERTFFGTYKVRLQEDGRYRSLSHGTTMHGMQSVAADTQTEPLSYYHRTGPFGEIVEAVPRASGHREIAVVGLGVGSLASYRRPDQRWTFFEIDPAVERIARRAEHFTYLASCADACTVVLGDARQSLKALDGNEYGVIVLDAFSSDAIPMHLVTREALQIYLARLAPGGVLAFHISNRHLDLEPVLARLAEGAQLTALIRRDRIPNDTSPDGKASSDWLVMTRSTEDFDALTTNRQWTPAATNPRVALWTDDFSNILAVLSRR